MEKEELELQSKIFSDLWKFRKTFYSVQNDDTYWQAVMDEANAISKRYGSKFVDSMLIVCYGDLEARHRDTAGMKKEKSNEVFDFCLKLMRCL